MGRPLPAASELKLKGVNYRLADFIRQLSLVSPVPFIVMEGLRTRQRQRELYNAGKSKTLNSLHIVGRAVDIAPEIHGRISWEWKHFTPIIEAAKAHAVASGIRLKFGYDWGWDAPHIEMREP